MGIVAALWGTRVLAGFLYEVEPTDPATFAGVAVLLSAVAALACLRPALQATAVDPIEVLKEE